MYEFGSANDVGTASGYAKNTVVLKVDGDLEINSNVTLTSVKSSGGYGGPKGMIIYCTGTITNNGTISMTARGGKAVGENVYLWRNENESYEYIPAVGGAGGVSVKSNSADGVAGLVGIRRSLGGGGSGANASGGGVGSGYGNGGSGSTATSYSGGTGGGGCINTGTPGDDGGANGGAGGYRKKLSRTTIYRWRSWKSRRKCELWNKRSEWNRRAFGDSWKIFRRNRISNINWFEWRSECSL